MTSDWEQFQSAILVAGLLTQAAAAAVFAVLLRRFHRLLGRGYLREWALAWVAIACADVAGGASLAVAGELPPTHPLRFAASAVYLVGGFWHAAWILFGVSALAGGVPVSRRGGRSILAALGALGVVAALLWGFDPIAEAQRELVRVGVRGLVLAVALLAAGAMLARMARRGGAGTGPGFVGLAFLAAGARNLAEFAGVVGWLPRPPVWVTAPMDVLLTALLGLATVVWLLEEEQHRLRDASRQIERFAFYDVGTGLPNRKLFVDRLRQWLERAARDGEHGALLFLDLDHFKRVNDGWGHEIGDQMLAAVADRLLHAVHEGDTVARLGGDEFTILLSGVTGAEEAGRAAGQLLERLRQPLRIGEMSLFTGASVGVALYPADGGEAAVLLRKADAAMHRAKELGRGVVVFFDDELTDGGRERFTLETALREGRLEQDLELHYQPIVRSGSGDIVGAEALLRWRHPERGLLAPADFLYAAESAAVSEAVSRWVMRNACRTIADWRRRYLPDLRVAVNLTARAFENRQLAALVEEALTASGLPARALELEITETMALLQVDDPASLLADLRARGTRVAVDDFGTGYSSLSYLRELPVEIVKLDSSFIRDLGRRPQDSRIVGAVIQLAHGLGMEVVAEGVEEEAQMAVLEMLHCDRMQGYLFSRPLPAPEFETLLDAARPFRTTPLLAGDRLSP
jgi:diguanylate cyclase (GGDEF)-like protein